MDQHTAALLGAAFTALMTAIPATIYSLAKLQESRSAAKKVQVVTEEATGAVEAKSASEDDLRKTIRDLEDSLALQERLFQALLKQRLPPEAPS